ncbi:MAG: hypothetical protein LKI80_11340 [Sporolactobacillus sp.]|jgi:hypothetical protein|nr:hypothetical protein [Sporolactobacillus sp.]
MTDQEKIIGGYFSLELPQREEYHRQALRLNSGRYCLEYILRVRQYRKIYLPAYICDSVLQPVDRLQLDYAFYEIGKDFLPLLGQVRERGACVLYVDYFGLNGAQAREVCRRFPHVILDNTQAFFADPAAGVDTFYSTRKFFGVPDGGYLYTNARKQLDLDADPAYYRCDALLKQIDLGATAAEPLFEQNEAYLDTCGMHAMSPVTRRLLGSIDYRHVRERRNANFRYLHNRLEPLNQLEVTADGLNGPFCYPLLTDRGEALKEALLARRIYVNDYWQDVAAHVSPSSFEYRLAKRLIPLPVDQRYGEKEMHRIVQVVRTALN